MMPDKTFLIPEQYVANWDAMTNLYKEYNADIVTGKKPFPPSTNMCRSGTRLAALNCPSTRRPAEISRGPIPPARRDIAMRDITSRRHWFGGALIERRLPIFTIEAMTCLPSR